MSLEQKIEELTAAILANTAALGGAKPAAAGKAAAAEKPAAAGKVAAAEKPAAKQKRTQEEVIAALTLIKDEFDLDQARSVFQPMGYKKMSEILEKDFDRVFKAAEAKLAELRDEAGGEGEEM